VVSVLVMAWCVLDFSNHKAIEDLFSIGDVRMLDWQLSQEPSQIVAPFKRFVYPLTLAFLQFSFMGMLFLCMYFVVTQKRPADLRGLDVMSDKRWPAFVVSHVFSTFWLQSLMMPSQALSLGLFAATRAFEIPVAATMRPAVLGHHFGKKTLQASAFAFAASCLLYFAYAELAGCLCILSGQGVALTGLAFWIVYAMILSMPAVNAICQEGIMVEPGMHPLLVLALQNVFASLLFCPVLLLSHAAGWEDVFGGLQMIFSQRSVFLLVSWLCLAIALTSIVSIMLIQVVDSFWAIALRAMRVTLWGMLALVHFYFSSSTALSIADPRSSFWSFAIFCGCCLACAAIYTDRKSQDDFHVDKAGGGTFASDKATP
jgi:hypothetical protein